MNNDRFDAFVHSLDIAAPRRAALAGALGMGLPGHLTRFGVDIAAAKKRKKKKKCKGGKKRCGKTCIPKASCCGGCGEEQVCCNGTCAGCCTDTDCGAGGTCVDGTCICLNEGDVDCGQNCVDLATDGANCGACDNVCDTDACVHGACTCSISDDCPDDCICVPRTQGGNACVSGSGSPNCDTDEDCPVGSFCSGFVGFNACTEPCLG